MATVTLGPRNFFVINDLKLARELFAREDFNGRAHSEWLKLIKISNGKMREDLCTRFSRLETKVLMCLSESYS